MKISVITLFPGMIDGFLSESIVKRAQEKGKVEVELVNLRDFALDKHGTVDGRPYGGGSGMLLMVEPIYKAIRSIKSQSPNSNSQTSSKSKMQNTKNKIVLTSPKGTVYNQNKVREFSKLDHLILIAGHYEGVDERILTQVDEEISFGDFVMTGGEITAAAIVDSVVRLIPGVLEKTEAVQEESFFEASVSELEKIVGDDEIFNKLKARGKKSVQLLEYPHYTRPEEFKGQAVPRVLLSGDHAEIRRWRLSKAWEQTKKLRPDLIC